MRPLAKIERKPNHIADGYVDPLRTDEEQEKVIRDFVEDVALKIPHQAHMILFMDQKEGQINSILTLSDEFNKHEFRANGAYVQYAIESLKNKVETTQLFPKKDRATRPLREQTI